MLPTARRSILVIALLLIAVGLTWGFRLSAAARPGPEVQLPTGAGKDPSKPAAKNIYFLDVEGWYRITPYETVVRSPHDLTADTTEAMTSALPSAIGDWQQVGQDEYVGDDPAVVYYLKHPTVALQRTYQDPTGSKLALTIIGNRGEDSFLLFSHTPETCYPGRLWEVVESRRESAMLDDQPMYAQYLLTQQAETGERLMVLYWYLWDSPQRDPQDGVLSMRVNLFLSPGESQEAVLQRAWDFVRALFPFTVPWDRF